MSDWEQPEGARSASRDSTAAGPSSAGLESLVREQAADYVERHKDEAVELVSDIAQALRGGARSRPDGHAARAVFHMLADGLDGLSIHIDRRGVGELYRDAGDLAGRYPAVALSLAAAAGYGLFHLARSGGEDGLEP